ncbi:pao retrotransposon peptidase [Lasius niger]|uniref:Pao retrotransposon peptidase n=1 Tax=Lasius niger TaxID=67767 RepID=A0A0J7KAC6_LASNI|nr:pao retrotransposon peptidase [Lasius niger]
MVLRSSCFELAKWKLNEPTLFERDTEEFIRITTGGEEIKTLGLSWAPSKDTFQYQVTAYIPRTSVTKRTELSITSQIFDPLGLVGPVTFKAKILLQKLWQFNLGWNESLPVNLHTEWTTCDLARNQAQLAERFEFLRLWWYGPEWLQHPEEYIHTPAPLPRGEIPETKKYAMLVTQVVETNTILK